MNAFLLLFSSALIYLEVHEEIFNEITSCLCVSDVALFPFFLPTQSKSLFNEDMNTQNSNFGGLNVKHDELKNEYFFVLRTGMDDVDEKTTSSSILKIHKTQKNRETRNKFIIMPWRSERRRNVINRTIVVLLISLLAKISDPKKKMKKIC